MLLLVIGVLGGRLPNSTCTIGSPAGSEAAGRGGCSGGFLGWPLHAASTATTSRIMRLFIVLTLTRRGLAGALLHMTIGDVILARLDGTPQWGSGSCRTPGNGPRTQQGSRRDVGVLPAGVQSSPA